MISTVCFVSYHELGLKGKNRSTFERRLQDNLDAALVCHTVGKAKKIAGRITVEIFPPADATNIARVIAGLPGVTSVAIAYRIGRSLQEIEHVALRTLQEAGAFTTFRVKAKRSNTDFPINSMELNRKIGSFLVEHTGAKVQLKDPDVTVAVTVVGGATFVSAARIIGIGGLPVGSSGKVISLLSSGIDSPVATWRIMRRGAVGIGLHFSGRPAVNDDSERVVREIGAVLSSTGGLGRIYVVPFGDIQREIASIVFPDLRILMYRRVMIAVAERLARIEGAKALVTGESLGQVASQTLDNIRAVDDVATLPVLRPLIGNDKNEIVEEAKRIGTFDLSIQDVSDCCTLFMPRRPETHAKLDLVHAGWAMLDIESMIQRCMDSIEWVDFPCRRYRQPKVFRTALTMPTPDEALNDTSPVA